MAFGWGRSNTEVTNPEKGTTMSFLRGIPVAVLALGGLLAAPSVASASATASGTASAVHTAPCTGQTFNVHSGRTLCYAGTGSKAPHIRAVRRITTGRYWGCLEVIAGGKVAFGNFHPNELVGFPRPVQLMSFELARHQIACRK